ncbi:MAG: glycosyltransferase family 4 protein [Candidatus Dormibacteraeota bacterium]|nr:glycosyltransferase family 4 protein [Candidatus Dormibacteraeota bacterium]
MGRSLRIGLSSPYFGSTLGGGEKYLGVAAEALRDAYPQHRVEIVSPMPADRARYERVLDLDLEGIELRSDVQRVTPVHRMVARLPALRPLRNRLVARQAARRTAAYDLWLGMVYVIPASSSARRSVMLCQFPYPLQTAALRRGVDSFDPIVCQSEYVRRCVARYWRRDAEVLFPPIDVPAAEPDWDRKLPYVLSVGRFVAGGHNKRHDVLAQAFRELCDGGLSGWELHLVGNVHRDEASLAYYRRVLEAARGYPIHVHADLSRAELARLYGQASIYWHAAGYGVDGERRPEALEHFGMTTAEAMAHGAVPVVIARGGQPEVVREGVDGHLWDDLDVLRCRTRELAADPARLRALGEAARASSMRFSRPAFSQRLLEILGPIVGGLEADPQQTPEP